MEETDSEISKLKQPVKTTSAIKVNDTLVNGKKKVIQKSKIYKCSFFQLCCIIKFSITLKMFRVNDIITLLCN